MDMASKNRKQIETFLVAFLAKGGTVAQAVLQTGRSESTIYRYLRQPDFQARIQAVQDETLQRAAAALTAAIQGGIHSLVALQHKDTLPSVRRAAARDILEVGLRLRATAELEKRLLALENRTANPDVSMVPGTGQALPPPVPPPAVKRRRRGDNILMIALASGDLVSQGASKASMSERTAYRRLQDPVFRKGMEALRAETVQRGAAVLIAATILAVKTLIELQDASIPACTRRRAARDILEMSEQMRQATFLEKRLRALEEYTVAG
jgi:hypothetical protein